MRVPVRVSDAVEVGGTRGLVDEEGEEDAGAKGGVEGEGEGEEEGPGPADRVHRKQEADEEIRRHCTLEGVGMVWTRGRNSQALQMGGGGGGGDAK